MWIYCENISTHASEEIFSIFFFKFLPSPVHFHYRPLGVWTLNTCAQKYFSLTLTETIKATIDIESNAHIKSKDNKDDTIWHGMSSDLFNSDDENDNVVAPTRAKKRLSDSDEDIIPAKKNKQSVKPAKKPRATIYSDSDDSDASVAQIKMVNHYRMQINYYYDIIGRQFWFIRIFIFANELHGDSMATQHCLDKTLLGIWLAATKTVNNNSR